MPQARVYRHDRFSLLAVFTTSVPTSARERQDDNCRHEPKLIELDAPGAATVSSTFCGTSCGTFAFANNDFGVITGYYTDTNVVPHGFLRLPNGHLTAFDAPAASLGAGLNQGTVACAINTLGGIAGQIQDSSHLFDGFVRYPNGSFTTLDEPNAGAGPNEGTQAFDVNLFRTTTGSCVDASGVQHGFIRAPSNNFTSFASTGSVLTYICEETRLNPEGTVAGFHYDSSFIPHGFVRQRDGAITQFDAPEAVGGTVAGSLCVATAGTVCRIESPHCLVCAVIKVKRRNHWDSDFHGT